VTTWTGLTVFPRIFNEYLIGFAMKHLYEMQIWSFANENTRVCGFKGIEYEE